MDEGIYQGFYQEIEDHYHVQLRRSIRNDWKDYWAWFVLYFYLLEKFNLPFSNLLPRFFFTY